MQARDKTPPTNKLLARVEREDNDSQMINNDAMKYFMKASSNI